MDFSPVACSPAGLNSIWPVAVAQRWACTPVDLSIDLQLHTDAVVCLKVAVGQRGKAVAGRYNIIEEGRNRALAGVGTGTAEATPVGIPPSLIERPRPRIRIDRRVLFLSLTFFLILSLSIFHYRDGARATHRLSHVSRVRCALAMRLVGAEQAKPSVGCVVFSLVRFC